MPLNIETFSNAVGGNAFYKAVTHPLAAEPARAPVAKLRTTGPVAIYDPHNLLAGFDALRLPDDMLSDKARYLSNLNFATNFAFFRDGKGHHTRLVTANYWSAY